MSAEIVQVLPGTVITAVMDDGKRRRLKVRNGRAVSKAGTIYMTPSDYAKVKDKLDEEA